MLEFYLLVSLTFSPFSITITPFPDAESCNAAPKYGEQNYCVAHKYANLTVDNGK